MGKLGYILLVLLIYSGKDKNGIFRNIIFGNETCQAANNIFMRYSQFFLLVGVILFFHGCAPKPLADASRSKQQGDTQKETGAVKKDESAKSMAYISTNYSSNENTESPKKDVHARVEGVATGQPDPAQADGQKEEVKWYTFEEAVKESTVTRKKIFIDIYTDWCGWCKVMDRNTFTDSAVAKLLNEKFYPVKLNAEQREDIVFDGHTFKFVEGGRNGYHELAAALLNNKMSYPTVVFLAEDFKIIQPLPGYRKADEFHKIAKYIGDDHFRSTSWEEFQKTYKSPYQ